MLIAALLATLAVQQHDPLAPARDGQVLCYAPDVDRKTCYGVAAYRWLDDGTIVSDITVAVSADPVVRVRSSAPVFIRDGAECTLMIPSWTQITAIYEDGEWLRGADFESYRRLLGSSIDSQNGPGRELCFTYEPPVDGQFIATARVDGKVRPDLQSIGRWVRLEDGWRLETPR